MFFSVCLDIVKCLQETIDVYEALARHDFDRIVDKNNIETSSSSDDSITNKNDNSAQSTIPSFQIRPPPPLPPPPPPTTTTSSSLPLFNFTKTITTTNASSDSTPPTGFSFKLPTTTASPEKPTNTSPFTFSIPHTGFGTVIIKKKTFCFSSIPYCDHSFSQHSVLLVLVIQ